MSSHTSRSPDNIIQAYVASMGSRQSHQHSKYDPVPPYDLDEVESSIPASEFSIDTVAAAAGAGGEGTPAESSTQRAASQQDVEAGQAETNCKSCNRHYGRLTERERCNYALMFVLMSLGAACIMVSVIVSGAVKGRKT